MDILVSGALGRMGHEVIRLIEKEPDLNFVCGFGLEDSDVRWCACLQGFE